MLITSATLFLFIEKSKGDLPIHALADQVAGDWIFHLSDSDSRIVTCGAGVPDKNTENLNQAIQLKYDQWIDLISESQKQPLEISLLKTHDGSHHKGLTAKYVTPSSDTNSENGSWTMIYDEGFEVQMPDDIKLTALLHYEKKKNCFKNENEDEVTEDPDGSTGCYETDPHRTLIGWYEKEKTKEFGCFYGKQNNHSSDKKSLNANSAPQFTKLGRRNTRATVSLASKSETSLQVLGRILNEHFVEEHNKKVNRKWTAKLYPEFLDSSLAELLQLLGSKKSAIGGPSENRNSHMFHKSSSNEKSSDFPNEFSWGDPMVAPEKMSTSDFHVLNQGDCGACYSVAATYVLQKRAEIQKKKISKGIDESLSPLTALRCSFYDQGCAGGYPFLVGKFASQIGIGSSKCEGFYSPKSARYNCQSLEVSSDGQMPPLRFVNKESTDCPRTFASDYGYVGGCYGCSNAALIQKEIAERGPVVAAVNLAPTILTYHSGIFDDRASNDNGREALSSSFSSSRASWEFTNHAVVLVGFGEDENDGTKYWIVRNSWGSNWGQGGYFKILRGVNLGGIEHQAVFIDPK